MIDSFRLVVGEDNRVAIRPVKVGEQVGTMCVVLDGLKAGVVVETLRPGMPVQPKWFRGSAE